MAEGDDAAQVELLVDRICDAVPGGVLTECGAHHRQIEPLRIAGAETEQAMLDMRPDCERCGTDLPAQAPGAFICSFECTFCADCANDSTICAPIVAANWMDRPDPSKKLHEKFPPATKRKAAA